MQNIPKSSIAIENTSERKKKLTSRVFGIIRAKIIPDTRLASDGSLLLVDWIEVLQMAHYLGFDIKTEAKKLSIKLKASNCAEFSVQSLDDYRSMLAAVDRNLGSTYLFHFDNNLAFLRSAFKEPKQLTNKTLIKFL